MIPDAARLCGIAAVDRNAGRMGRWFYRISRAAGQFTFFCTMNARVLHPQRVRREGPFVLAPTHLANTEPFCLSVLVSRPIDWMTREEYFRNPVIAMLLRGINGYKVNRFGVPVSAVRTSMRKLDEGKCIGIFPEGGSARGGLSAMRGGPIKHGACMIACRSGVPIVPVALLGTDKLNSIRPWLPLRQAKVWIAYGEPIDPPKRIENRREARRAMAAQLSAAYVSLYREMREAFGIADSDVP